MKRTPFVHIGLLIAFLFNSLITVPLAQAQELLLPKAGVMVHLSPPTNPPVLRGLKINADNPFRFEFILDRGDRVETTGRSSLQDDSTRLIKYFLASLTIPEKDLWVNLSPYEKNRIVPDSFGLTEMGRDLLAQDYMLKQVTASLIYPEDEVGKKFWRRVYEEAAKKYGNTNIPVNTFNKVWIVPEKAVVYENAKAGTAYVVESKLKVMLEADYLSLEKNTVGAGLAPALDKRAPARGARTDDVNQIGSQIVREIVIPELTKEINEGANFAQLRQVYSSLILATWYKKKIKDSILSKVYADRNKIAGIQINDVRAPLAGALDGMGAGVNPARTDVEQIYQQYLTAFKKGVYNYIKEDIDPATQEKTPRKYFSGGADLAMSGTTHLGSQAFSVETSGVPQAAMLPSDRAMLVSAGIQAVKNIFKPRAEDKEIQSVIQRLSALESAYREALWDLEHASNPSEVLALIKRLEKAYQELSGELNAYLQGGVLDESTPAYKAFLRYNEELQLIDEEVFDILSVYLSKRWPNSIEKRQESIDQRAKDVEEKKGPYAVSELEALRKDIIGRAYQRLSGEAGRKSGRFQIVLMSTAISEGLKSTQLSLEQIEAYVKVGYALWDDEGLDQLDFKMNEGLDQLEHNIAGNRTTGAQQKYLREMITQQLEKDLTRAKLRVNRSRWIRGGVLAALIGASVSAGLILSGNYSFNQRVQEKTAVPQVQTVNHVQPKVTEQIRPAVTVMPLNEIMKFNQWSAPAKAKVAAKDETDEQKLEKARLKAQVEALEEEMNNLEKEKQLKIEEMGRLDQENEAIKRRTLMGFNSFDESIEDKPIAGAPSTSSMLTQWHDAPKLEADQKALSTDQSDTQGFTPKASQLGHGFDPATQQQWVANAHVKSAYLVKANFHLFDMINGKMMADRPQLKEWALTQQTTDEWIEFSSQGKTKVQVLVPPNDKITAVKTQNSASVRVMFDESNKSWWLVFDRDPGFIKEYVAPAQSKELGELEPVKIVDSEGRVLSAQEIDVLLARDLPAPLWQFIQKYRGESLGTRQWISDQLGAAGWLFYTVNPLLSNHFNAQHSFVRDIYVNYAEQCNGFACSNLINETAMNVSQLFYDSGYMVNEAGVVSASDAHAWNRSVDGTVIESTEQAGAVSPLKPDREGITPEDFKRELDYIHSRALLVNQQMQSDLRTMELKLEQRDAEEAADAKKNELARARDQLQAAIEGRLHVKGLMDDVEIKQQILTNALKLRALEDMFRTQKVNEIQLSQMFEGMIDQLRFDSEEDYILKDNLFKHMAMILLRHGVNVFPLLERYAQMAAKYQNINSINDHQLIELGQRTLMLSNQTSASRLYGGDLLNKGNPTHLGRYFEVSREVSDYLIDADTYEVIEIPQGYKVVDDFAGLILLNERGKENNYCLMSRQKDGSFKREYFKNGRVKIYHLPSSPDNWLGVYEKFSGADSGTRLIGPMAVKLNLSGLKIHDFPAVYSYQGKELIIYHEDDINGYFRLEGSLANEWGVQGLRYEFVAKPIIGKDSFILPVKVSSFNWKFLGTAQIKSVSSIDADLQMYSDDQWVLPVIMEGEGGIETPQFLTNIQVGYSPYTLIEGGSTFSETEAGDMVVLDQAGNPVQGNVPGYTRMLQQYFNGNKNLQIKFSGFKRTSNKSEWMAKAVSAEGKEFIVGSQGVMTKIASSTNGGTVNYKKVIDYDVFDNGEFYVMYEDSGNQLRIVGSWADRHLNTVDMDNGSSLVFLLKPDGTKDPSKYIAVSSKTKTAYGSIAKELGLTDKKFESIKVTNLHNGAVAIRYVLMKETPQPVMNQDVQVAVYDPSNLTHEVHGEAIAANLTLAEDVEQEKYDNISKTAESFRKSSGPKVKHVPAIPPERLDLWLRSFAYDGEWGSLQRFLALSGEEGINASLNMREVRQLLLEKKEKIAEGILNHQLDAYQFLDVLRKYQLRDVFVAVALEGLTGPDYRIEAFSRIIGAAMKPADWQELLRLYEGSIRKDMGINDTIGDLYVSMLTYSNIDVRTRLNEMIKARVSPFERQQLERYDQQLAADRKILVQAHILSDAPLGQMQRAAVDDVFIPHFLALVRFFHEQTPDISMPFDIQHSSKDAPYVLSRLILRNSPLLKSRVQEQYRVWKEINASLNEVHFSFDPPPVSVAWSEFFSLLKDDPMAMAYFGALIYLMLKWRSEQLRKKDKLLLGATGRESFERLWQQNPWFNGEGYGGIPGAKELTERLMFDGFSLNEMDELKRLRASLKDERQRAVVDAVLALPSQSPQDASTSKWQALVNLVPFIGLIIDALVTPKAFNDRQRMKKAIEAEFAVLDDQTSPADFLSRIQGIIQQYVEPVINAQAEQLQSPLSFDEVSARLIALSKQEEQVWEENGSQLSMMHDGIPSKKVGPGTELGEHRAYVPGDDTRKLDWKVFAKTDKNYIKQSDEQKALRTGIIVNLTDLASGKEEVLKNFIDAVRVNLFKRRVSPQFRANYHLEYIILLKADGTSRMIALPRMSADKPWELVASILNRREFKEDYQSALTSVISQQQVMAPAFYNREEQQEWLDRQTMHAKGVNEAGAGKLGVLLKSADLQRLYLVGLDDDQESRQQISRKLPRQTAMYAWTGAQSQEQVSMWKVDRAMGSDKTGGIDFNADKINLQIQHAGEEIKFKMDPMMLQQLQQAKGFEPIIFNIQPLSDLRLFLGLNQAGQAVVSS